MKKPLLILVLIMVFSGCGNIDQSPLGPKAKNNGEVMEYVQVLKEDFSLINEKLEILRKGVIGGDGYALRNNHPDYNGVYIFIYGESNYSLLSENIYDVSQQEIDAIDYLFDSDKLQLNVLYVDYGEPHWNRAIGSQGAMFAEVENGHFYIGIFYFENNEVPEELQNSKDYVEELSDNYWIVACNMQRP